jgi:hypothetical protein
MRLCTILLLALLASPALAGSFTTEPGSGGTTDTVQPGTAVFFQATGIIKTITDLDRSTGDETCAAGKTCIEATSHGLVDGDVVIFAGVGGTVEINGLISVVESAATNTFRVPISSAGFTVWTSGGTVRKRLFAPLGLGRCATYSVSFVSNIASASDFDATLYPWRCPPNSNVSLPPDDLVCDLINFSGDTALTGAFGDNAYFDDVPPQKLVIDLNVPDAQVSRVQVDCR